MGVPNTGGSLKTNIADMQIGDYIVCNYDYTGASNVIGSFYDFGVIGAGNPEIPVTGKDGVSTPYGYFYFIKVDKGLLVSDRVIQHSVSWDTLNNKDVIQGSPISSNIFYAGKAPTVTNGIIRSLGGGNSYASATGTSSFTDSGNGAWPTTNEWDEYIVRKDYGGAGPGADSIWHWNNILTWTQETISSIVASNSATRICRGYNSNKNLGWNSASLVTPSLGFRPCFEYTE
jgi:hypothetical protein